MPDEIIYLDNGQYLGVYVILYFKNKYSVYNKEDQAYMYPDMDEEEMYGVRLDDKIYRHWKIFFEKISDANRWDVCI